MGRCGCAALALLALAACSSNNASKQDEADSGRGTTDDSGAFETGDTEGIPVEAGLYAPEGTAVLADGALAELSFQFVIYADDTAEGPLCTVSRSTTAIEARELTPGDEVYHWWRLDLGAATSDCAPAVELPDALWFGLGALHPQVAPGLLPAGLADVEASMYGAYLGLEDPLDEQDEGTAYAYGFAGTAADRAGETVAATAPPLPDGSYAFQAWFLFEVP